MPKTKEQKRTEAKVRQALYDLQSGGVCIRNERDLQERLSALSPEAMKPLLPQINKIRRRVQRSENFWNERHGAPNGGVVHRFDFETLNDNHTEGRRLTAEALTQAVAEESLGLAPDENIVKVWKDGAITFDPFGASSSKR